MGTRTGVLSTRTGNGHGLGRFMHSGDAARMQVGRSSSCGACRLSVVDAHPLSIKTSGAPARGPSGRDGGLRSGKSAGRGGFDVGTIRPCGISTWQSRRRRDPSPRNIARAPPECREGRYGWASAIESTRFVLEWNIPVASAQESPISKLRIAIECSRSGASDATAGRRPLDGRDSHLDRISSPHLPRIRQIPSAE